MGDLISRNALLDAMPKNDELLSVDVRRIICESPKVDAEPVITGETSDGYQPKWISVDVRLPDEPGEVLACVYGRICIAWYSNRCFETPSGMVFYACENAVTHWMPTPEPPKDEP